MQENNMVEFEVLSTESNIIPNQTKFDHHEPVKKKRNLAGTPDPDADVIALSPETLLATNRFVCEICNKGFQRDQNLQLHRRGHNLPWKLRSGKELRKRVYVCPEPTCVHHNPSRALGDLTGIKKHFCRKHLDKKYKCQRCPKTYALLSDCKAHIKACGTREYSCRCGTLFSRRDSFVTHRAFCDALSRENNARSQPPPMVAPLPASTPPPPLLTPSAKVLSPVLSIQSSATVELPENPNAELQPATAAAATRSSFLGSMPSTYPSLLCSIARPHERSLSLSLFENQQLHYAPRQQPAALSATALLQKAAQMGATSSGSSFLLGLGLALPSSSSLDNTSSSSLKELMMSSSTLFRSKPATLDLLGLGVAAAEASCSSERKYNQTRFCNHD